MHSGSSVGVHGYQESPRELGNHARIPRSIRYTNDPNLKRVGRAMSYISDIRSRGLPPLFSIQIFLSYSNVVSSLSLSLSLLPRNHQTSLHLPMYDVPCHVMKKKKILYPASAFHLKNMEQTLWKIIRVAFTCCEDSINPLVVWQSSVMARAKISEGNRAKCLPRLWRQGRDWFPSSSKLCGMVVWNTMNCWLVEWDNNWLLVNIVG